MLVGQYIPGGMGGGGASNFLALSDSPDTYAGQAGKAVVVKGNESGVAFATLSGSGSGGGGLLPVYVNTSITADINTALLVDTLSSAITILLPDSPDQGARVAIVDVRGYFGTNKVTISPNGRTIENSALSLELSHNNLFVEFVYCEETNDWRVTQQVGSRFSVVGGNAVPITGNYTASPFETLTVDTSISVSDITLPANPSVGDWVRVIDAMATSSINNITVKGNGNKIDGYVIGEDFIINRDGAEICFTFVGGSRGWHIDNGGKKTC